MASGGAYGLSTWLFVSGRVHDILYYNPWAAGGCSTSNPGGIRSAILVGGGGSSMDAVANAAGNQTISWIEGGWRAEVLDL